MTHRKLLIIGDSFTLGAADVRGNEIVEHVRESYVDRLRASLPQVDIRIDAEVYRHTSAVRNIVEGLLDLHEPRVVLLTVGSSDADLDWRRFVLSEGQIIRNRVALATYEKNL